MYSYCGNNPVNRIDSNGRFFEKIGWCLKKAWNGIKTFFKNTFGAGASTTVQKYDVYTENTPEPFNAVVSQKTGRKEKKVVSKHGDTSKTISVYAEERADNIIFSSAGIKINFCDFTIQANLSVENLGVSLLKKNGESYSFYRDFSQTSFGFEYSQVTVDWDEGTSIIDYSNVEISFLTVIFALVGCSSPSGTVNPLPAYN